MKIDPHDIEIRMKQARRFLMEGHKVQIVQNFRGREMAHRERGSERMREIFEQLEDIAKIELAPRMAGRRMTMVIAPDRQKVQKIENDQKREAAQAEAEAAANAEGPGTEAMPPEASGAGTGEPTAE